ncbi:hypothetical protein ACFHYQ_00950 [Sphaerimonospora cavernae]|uniref:CPBP family intramembrane metalloprotease n=1 Tax=Sphaerimonospora cavernae TaxID=1740611 RepID=A0ABV6TXC4_9ACTN
MKIPPSPGPGWKFNSPPGWPPTPEGWEPNEGWAGPDPSWPAPPSYWSWWVRPGAAAAAPSPAPTHTTQQHVPYQSGAVSYGRDPASYARSVTWKPSTSAIPSGLRFHLLARTPLNSPSRTIGALVAGLVGGTVVGLIGAALAGAVAVIAGYGETHVQRTVSDSQWELISSSVALSLVLAYLLVVPRLVQGRPLGSLISVEGKPRADLLISCLGLAVIVEIVSYGFAFALGRLDGSTVRPLYYWVDGLSMASLYPIIIIMILLVPAAAWWPCVMGFILQAPGIRTATPWAGIAAATVASVLIQGAVTPGFAAVDLLSVTIFALMGAWLAVRTGGLEAAYAMNLASISMNTLKQIGVAQLHVAPIPPEGLYLVGQLIGPVLFVTGVMFLAKILRIRVLSP